MTATSNQEVKPMLLFFFDPTDGRARRVDAFIAQVLQRRGNHDTFQLHRVDVQARPELLERFGIEYGPSICVVDERRVALRLCHPRNAREIERHLAPWLRRGHSPAVD
jgi:thioredoxin-like negative regulator of GroEL